MTTFELLNLPPYKSSETLSVSLPTVQSFLRMETARIVWSADANPSQLPTLAAFSFKRFQHPREDRPEGEGRQVRAQGMRAMIDCLYDYVGR